MTRKFDKQPGEVPAYAASLTKIREDLGLSQDQMAEKVGVSQPTWCNYEGGHRKPGRRTMLAIQGAAGLGVKAYQKLSSEVDEAVLEEALAAVPSSE